MNAITEARALPSRPPGDDESTGDAIPGRTTSIGEGTTRATGCSRRRAPGPAGTRAAATGRSDNRGPGGQRRASRRREAVSAVRRGSGKPAIAARSAAVEGAETAKPALGAGRRALPGPPGGSEPRALLSRSSQNSSRSAPRLHPTPTRLAPRPPPPGGPVTPGVVDEDPAHQLGERAKELGGPSTNRSSGR